jgi:PncC family amidohydrolase
VETLDLDIVRKIHEAFLAKGLTLAVSEPLTAGLLSLALTSLSGSSGFFDSSLVCYSVQSREKLLGLGPPFLREDAARAMAEATRDRTGADVALAVVGNPGPGPVEEMEPGLVFVAVSTAEQTTSRGFKYEGPRQRIRRSAAEEAFHFLYEAVSVWT